MADSARYLLGRRRIQENYDTGVAAADYAQELERAREQRDRTRNEYDEWSGRRRNAWNSTRRGFHNTGGGQAFYNGEVDRQFMDRWTQHYAANQQRLQQIELQRQQLLRDRNYGLQDLEVTEAERQMNRPIMDTSPGVEVMPLPEQSTAQTPDASTNPYHPYSSWSEWYNAVGRWM